MINQKNLLPIAEFIIIENVNGKDLESGMNIFDNKDKIKIVRKAGGSSATIYKGTAESFLKTISWAYQHLDWNKLEEK